MRIYITPDSALARFGLSVIAFLLLSASVAFAEVTRFEVESRGDLPGNMRYGLDELLPIGARVGSNAMACPAWVVLGEKHNALEALHAAMEARSPWLILMLHDPRLADIRDEPLFRGIRQEVLGN